MDYNKPTWRVMLDAFNSGNLPQQQYEEPNRTRYLLSINRMREIEEGTIQNTGEQQ